MHFFACRTVFILSEALDEQLKALWFSPFQTDDIETDLDMVRGVCNTQYAHSQNQEHMLGHHNYGKNYNPGSFAKY